MTARQRRQHEALERQRDRQFKGARIHDPRQRRGESAKAYIRRLVCYQKSLSRSQWRRLVAQRRRDARLGVVARRRKKRGKR